MNLEQQTEKMSHIYARSWSDEGFRQSLLADPAAVLKAEGFDLAEGMRVVALQDTETVHHLVLPPAAGRELSDAQLVDVSGGGAFKPFTVQKFDRFK